MSHSSQDHHSLHEATVNILAESTKIEGRVIFTNITRVHGVLIGEVRADLGSTLILTETAVVEGNIDADTLVIDGYTHGDIHARTRVVISRTGRVVGNIKTPSLALEFGAFFEGQCSMEKEASLTNEKS